MCRSTLIVKLQREAFWENIELIDLFLVVDAYSGWCGPCKAIESTFRRIRNETGDDLLHFAMVIFNK